MSDFKQALETLESAEDFLEYFQISYDPKIVQVNRLHILKRFHDYLARTEINTLTDEEAQRQTYSYWLQQAYQDFVNSDAQTEKVFRVFHRQQPQQVVIPVDQLIKRNNL